MRCASWLNPRFLDCHLANGWSLRCFSVAIYEKKQIKLSEPNLYSYSYIQEKWIELQWYIYVLLLLFKVWLSSVGQPKVYSCLPAWGYSSKSGGQIKAKSQRTPLLQRILRWRNPSKDLTRVFHPQHPRLPRCHLLRQSHRMKYIGKLGLVIISFW